MFGINFFISSVPPPDPLIEERLIGGWGVWVYELFFLLLSFLFTNSFPSELERKPLSQGGGVSYLMNSLCYSWLWRCTNCGRWRIRLQRGSHYQQVGMKLCLSLLFVSFVCQCKWQKTLCKTASQGSFIVQSAYLCNREMHFGIKFKVFRRRNGDEKIIGNNLIISDEISDFYCFYKKKRKFCWIFVFFEKIVVCNTFNII